MLKRKIIGIAVAAAVALGAGSAWAESDTCGKVGVWFGTSETVFGPLTWLGNNTPATSATAGQLSLEWVAVPAGFLGNFGVDRLTNAQGIWEKAKKKGEYRFSWVAYGINNTAPWDPIYMMRVSGPFSLVDCDHANVSYTIEFFLPPSNPNPVIIPGTANETRMRMP